MPLSTVTRRVPGRARTNPGTWLVTSQEPQRKTVKIKPKSRIQQRDLAGLKPRGGHSITLQAPISMWSTCDDHRDEGEHAIRRVCAATGMVPRWRIEVSETTSNNVEGPVP